MGRNGSMPYSELNMLSTREHERTIIATVAQRPSLMAEVCVELRDEHFGEPELAEVWRLMRDHGAYDARALNALLPDFALRALGGPAGVAELMTLAPVLDLSPYVEQVLRGHERRTAHRAFAGAMRALEGGARPEEALRDVMSAVTPPALRSAYTAADAELLLREYVGSLTQQRTTGFGVGALDVPMGGLRAGRLHVVAAQSGGGKTTLMMQAALQAALHGRQAVVVSAEMSASALMAICVSHLACLSLSPQAMVQMAKQPDRAVADKMKRAIERLRDEAGDRLKLIELAQPTPEHLALFCQRHIRGEDGLLICDYIQIMGEPRGAANREQAVARNVARMKAIATEYGVAVLTASQLNRELMLRESDAILHHADVVLRLDCDVEEALKTARRQVTARCLKNRGASPFVAPLVFAADQARFYGVADERI